MRILQSRTAESLLCSPLLQGCWCPSMMCHRARLAAVSQRPRRCTGKNSERPDSDRLTAAALTLRGISGGSGSSSVLPAPILATPVLGLLLPVLGLLLPVPRLLLAIPGVPAIARLLPVAWPLRVLLHGHVCRPLRQR